MSMTYSLFEFVKEKFEELILEQPDQTVIESTDIDKLTISDPQVSYVTCSSNMLFTCS